jgi:agmatinase
LYSRPPTRNQAGFTGAESIEDRSISTFARGELPHYAGISTFMKAPYVENVHDAGRYDAAVVGVPFDGGTTFRPGTRFGPQGIRRISGLYTPYNFEIGVDLREQMTMCDLGDVFTIPANLEKTFYQISRAVAHVFSIVFGRRSLDRLSDISGKRPRRADVSAWRSK